MNRVAYTVGVTVGVPLMLVGFAILLWSPWIASAQVSPPGATTDYIYSKSLTPEIICENIGVGQSKCAKVSVTEGVSGCVVHILRPWEIEVNQLFDGQGNILEETIVEVQEPPNKVVKKLHIFMQTVDSCGFFESTQVTVP